MDMDKVEFSWKDNYRDHWKASGSQSFQDEYTGVSVWWFEATNDTGRHFSFPVEMMGNIIPKESDIIRGMINYITNVSVSLLTDKQPG